MEANAGVLENATVLAVDDIPESLERLVRVLGDFCEMRTATSGPEALGLASSGQQPDLILLDLMMPGMDGYEVCRRLKSDVATRDIPVIFVAARSEIEDEQEVLDVGAVDYVTKPISPPIVRARVEAHLKLKVLNDLLRDRAEQLDRESMWIRMAMEVASEAFTLMFWDVDMEDESITYLSSSSLGDTGIPDDLRFKRFNGRKAADTTMRVKLASRLSVMDRSDANSVDKAIKEGAQSDESFGFTYRVTTDQGGDSWMAARAQSIHPEGVAAPIVIGVTMEMPERD